MSARLPALSFALLAATVTNASPDTDQWHAKARALL